MTAAPTTQLAVPALEFAGVDFAYRDAAGNPVPVLTDVSLRLEAGEIVLLAGPSGAGKSTLLKLAMGMLWAQRGSVRVGERCWPRAGAREPDPPLRSQVQIVFQESRSALNPLWQVEELIAEPAEVHRRRAVEVGLAAAPPAWRLGARRRWRRQVAAAALAEVGLSPDLLGAYPHRLSGGQRQRVGIARALLLRPQLLLADEPTASLDPSAAAQIVNTLAELCQRHRTACLLVAHQRWPAAAVAHRALRLQDGRVAPLDSVDV